MPRKKVTFVKTEEVKEGKFKGLSKAKKSKKMSEKRAQKKQAKGQGFISKAYDSNPIEMSPYKMGHKDSAMKMESAKQEKYNLLHDGSWMSKHSKSAFQMGHSPVEMGHSPFNDTETPAERKARLKKENAAKLAKGKANLARLKAEAKAQPEKKEEPLTGIKRLARSIYNQFADSDLRN